MKICLISSTGGHFMQLKELIPLAKKHDFYMVIEKNIISLEYAKKNDYKIYYLKQQERKNISFIYKMLYNVFISLLILIKEQPDVVISTGAGATIYTCIWAKLLRKKIIYIESFAKIDSATKSGKLVYKFADRFYVQWPEMLELYPKAIYMGGIYK